MFWFRDHRLGRVRVDVAFTDATLDLQAGGGEGEGFAAVLADVVAATGVPFARLHQVHGDDVVVVTDDPPAAPSEDVPAADAFVTDRTGIGLMVRVADCVPVLLADVDRGVVGAVHAGRAGLTLGVAARAVERMRAAGAERVVGWVGPHVCGGCYEVPDELREQVAAVVPAARAQTTWGTPSLDIGSGVRSQLEALGVDVVGVAGCTREEPRLHSYRRDGAHAGRFAGLVWMSERTA